MAIVRTAILHYSSSPIVGGVEAVIDAQAAGFLRSGYPVTVVSGRGDGAALPQGAGFIRIPEMDSQHSRILSAARELEAGRVPGDFELLSTRLLDQLRDRLEEFEVVIVHNVFTKHFNLPLTAALARYVEERRDLRCIAWSHDFSWTSAHSRPRVHDGFPWELLRTPLPGVVYVTISRRRQADLAALFGCRNEEIRVVYNGVEPSMLFGLSQEGRQLVERLGLLECGLSLLMPVRVTQAKNIEYAIRLAAALRERGAQPRIVLTGPPDPHDPESLHYFESLRSLAGELGVEREMRFVYESGPQPDEPYRIGMALVSELYRVCDLLFMPSHREGFGMPILEAGLLGMPVVCTGVPAAEEIGGSDVLVFDPDLPPHALAERILSFVRSTPTVRLRAEVRRTYTWQAIFHREIEPLLGGTDDRG